ncbi:MAG: manganese efflux pump [Lachnospiraceae bacterium]|nr:manganese efflux pump [Lachnospiraceae bacterium]
MIGIFIGNSILLGIALAMDAFSVSVAHGLSDPRMKSARMATIAGVFAFFQFLMPMIGWICVHTIAAQFTSFERLVPWIALILLAVLGINMIREGITKKRDAAGSEEPAGMRFTAGVLFVQGIATSIDALSVGFTISGYGALMAFFASVIIAAVTFVICIGGVKIGQKIGARFTSYATIIGGLILIAIGIEIFVRNLLAG